MASISAELVRSKVVTRNRAGRPEVVRSMTSIRGGQTDDMDFDAPQDAALERIASTTSPGSKVVRHDP